MWLRLRGGGTVGSAGVREADGLRCKDAKRQRSEASIVKIYPLSGEGLRERVNLEYRNIRRYEGRLFTVNNLQSFYVIADSAADPQSQDISKTNQPSPQPYPIGEGVKPTYSPSKKAAFTLAEGATHVAHSDNTSRSAFTLAEVLITLGIIGVVAAMTMPGMIVKHQKQLASKRLELSYAILSQAISHAQVEHGDISSWGFISTTLKDPDNPTQRDELILKFVNYIKPYLKLSSEPELSYVYKKGYPSFYKSKSGLDFSIPYVCILELANGITFFVDINGDSSVYSTPIIYVDINAKQGPNIQGRDLFAFLFDGAKDMKLKPWGYQFDIIDLKNRCSDNSTNNLENFSCTALIMKNGWEITDDYPW